MTPSTTSATAYPVPMPSGVAQGLDGVPIARWGKDHWSLLAYVESQVVDSPDKVSSLDCFRMRCNQDRHPLLHGNSGFLWQARYGTRLSGYFDFEQRSDPSAAQQAGYLLTEHDDWDCLDDLAAANLVNILSLVNGKVLLTPAGSAIAAQLRRYKQQGGHFYNFNLAEASSAVSAAGVLS